MKSASNQSDIVYGSMEYCYAFVVAGIHKTTQQR